MRIVLYPVLAAALAGQSPQEESVARQREAIERQRTTLESQNGPLDLLRQAVEKQRASVLRQTRASVQQPEPGFFTIPWPNPPEAPAAPGPSLAWTTDCTPLAMPVLDPILDRASRENNVPSDLLRAVIRHESGFKPCAISPAGAMGLMQLMPSTAGDMHVDNPFDPEQNILGGSRFLRLLLDRYRGDYSLALGAYNAGPGRVDEAGGVPPIRETQDYVRGILDLVVR